MKSICDGTDLNFVQSANESRRLLMRLRSLSNVHKTRLLPLLLNTNWISEIRRYRQDPKGLTWRIVSAGFVPNTRNNKNLVAFQAKLPSSDAEGPQTFGKVERTGNKHIMTQDQDRLDTFDEVWSLGDPAKIEKRFGELIPAAEVEPSKSTYLQILTQIALAKAIQKQFSDAHQTLDIAQQQLETENEIAGVRLLLERGRVFH